jgi:hypothetical protein
MTLTSPLMPPLRSYPASDLHAAPLGRLSLCPGCGCLCEDTRPLGLCGHCIAGIRPTHSDDRHELTLALDGALEALDALEVPAPPTCRDGLAFRTPGDCAGCLREVL